MANPNTLSIAVADQAGVRQLMGVEVGSEATPVWHNSVSTDVAGVPTYRASANFTPQATAAVTIITIQGSATKTIRVKKILLGGVSTALSQSIFALQRTTVLGAGGTPVSPTVAQLDGNSAAATGAVKHYTGTLKAAGTPSGGPLNTLNIMTGTVTTPTVASVGGPQFLFPESGALTGSAIVLRGIADFIEVQNITPTNLAAGTVLAYAVEWTEDAS